MSQIPRIVLLFTAARTDKPTYRRGALDALAYPSGQIVRYSYRVGQIQKSLRSVEQLPSDGAAVIVLVDEATDGAVTYFPLRRVKILDGLPFSAGQEPILRERRQLSLELGDFVAYAHTQNPRQWHARISEFDQAREITGNKPSFFVIQANDIFRATLPSVGTAWEDVVVNVSASHSLEQASFVRVEHPKSVETGADLPLTGAFDMKAYVLQPGSLSRLNFAIYSKDGRETKVQLKSSAEDLFTVNQPFQSVVSGVAEKRAYIACKRTVEDRTAILSLEVAGDSTDVTVVNSPNPVFLIKTSVPLSKLLLFVALVLFGAFFVSWDPELVKQLWCTSHDKILGLLAKGVGAILLALAAWLAFRKLPSGGVS
jgi:hypothetical protein